MQERDELHSPTLHSSGSESAYIGRKYLRNLSSLRKRFYSSASDISEKEKEDGEEKEVKDEKLDRKERKKEKKEKREREKEEKKEREREERKEREERREREKEERAREKEERKEKVKAHSISEEYPFFIDPDTLEALSELNYEERKVYFLEHILNDKEQIRNLLLLLEKIHNSENLLFWIDVEELKNIDVTDEEQRKQKAKEILENYIVEGN